MALNRSIPLLAALALLSHSGNAAPRWLTLLIAALTGKIQTWTTGATLLLLCVAVAQEPLPAQTWMKVYGDLVTEDEAAWAIRETADQGFVVVGTRSCGVEETDAWVLKLNSDGDVVWQRGFSSGDPTDADATAVVITPGGFLAWIATRRDIPRARLTRFDDAGQIIWQKGTNLSLGACHWLEPTLDGGFITCTSGGYVIRIDSTGDIAWLRRLTEGSILDVQQKPDGSFYAAGTYAPIPGQESSWACEISPSGDLVWQNFYETNVTGNDARALDLTEDGGFVIMGRYGSAGQSADFWVLKLDSVGDVEWSRTYGGADFEQAMDIEQTDDLGYVVAGSTRSFGADSWNPWILKLDQMGVVTWEFRYGGDLFGQVYSIEETADGGYVLAGQGVIAGGAGASNVLVLKIGPDGQLEDVCGPAIPTQSLSRSVDPLVSPTTQVLEPRSWRAETGNLIPTDTTAEGVPPCCPYASAPAEVSAPGWLQPLVFTSKTDLTWEDGLSARACWYNLYRGSVADLPAGECGVCLQPDLQTNTAQDLEFPPSGVPWFYLVTGENMAGEGPMGLDSAGGTRLPGVPCP